MTRSDLQRILSSIGLSAIGAALLAGLVLAALYATGPAPAWAYWLVLGPGALAVLSGIVSGIVALLWREP